MNVLETMKQALAALEDFNEQSKPPRGIPLPAEIDTAMDALRAAIEQMEKAEPVAWIDNLGNVTRYESKYSLTPLYDLRGIKS